MLRIFHLDECETSPMAAHRGEQIKLINETLGTEKLDLHLNRLRPGGERGRLHRHNGADNVYIVKSGDGILVVEGKEYEVRENDVVYIPAGMSHSLSNLGERTLEIFEIYAPAGAQFDFEVVD